MFSDTEKIKQKKTIRSQYGNSFLLSCDKAVRRSLESLSLKLGGTILVIIELKVAANFVIDSCKESSLKTHIKKANAKNSRACSDGLISGRL